MNALQTISDRRTEILRDLAGRVAERLLRKGYCTYSLLGGDFGEVLFLYYYSRIDAGYERIADELLDKTFRSIRYLPLVGTYCNGLSGFGYGLLMLEEAGFVEGAAEALPELDVLHPVCNVGFMLGRQSGRAQRNSACSKHPRLPAPRHAVPVFAVAVAASQSGDEAEIEIQSQLHPLPHWRQIALRGLPLYAQRTHIHN